MPENTQIENENTLIKDFYDYLRYSISMVQCNLPAVVVEDIKSNLSEFIGKMSIEELENINKTLELYDEYFLKTCNVVEEMRKSIEGNPYSEEIKSVFREELGDSSVRLERLDFIRSFIASVVDMIDKKSNTLGDEKKRV